METSLKKVLIIGGGFAGLNAAKRLGNKPGVEVTLIDRKNYHLFQPLLYQVATAGLNPADIATPIRYALSKYKNIDVVLDEITFIDVEKNTARSDTHDYKFDYLVLACGSSHSYFGNDQWENQAPGLKTLEQATEIRRRILMAFEKAETSIDPREREALLTFVIVGGGPTGLELSGSIAELAKVTLSKDFRHIDPGQTKVILIEGSKRLVSAFNEKLSFAAKKSLEQMGVQVRVETRVTEITELGVKIGNEFISSRTVLWAAGVATNPIADTLPGAKDRAKRVIVTKDLSIPNHPNIFVLGDMAAVMDKGETLPGLAPVAIQEGIHTAKNILREIKDEPRKGFDYLDKGIMATIGRKKAIVQVKALRITGTIAWLMWLFVHIFYLIGFKNRFFVLLQWTWSYFTFKRGSRLITNSSWKEPVTKE